MMNLKLFRAQSAYKRHETFSFMMSLLAMSFGDRFCFSRKGGIGGGGWVHPKCANGHGHVWARLKKRLGWHWVCHFRPFWHKWILKKRSHLVGPPFPVFKAHFSAMAGWHFSRDLSRHLLIGGCDHSRISVKYGWNYLWEQFWAQQPDRTETGVCWRVIIECENDLEKKTRTPKS